MSIFHFYRAAVVAVWSLLALGAGCQTPPPELIDIGQVPDFAFTDERGEAIGTAQLKGKPWVANFLFTSCPTSCPPLARATEKLQGKIKGWSKAPHPVQIVSITVDPVTDTPARLSAFAKEYHADPALWRFARGEYDAMDKLVTRGFMQALVRSDASGAKTLEDRAEALKDATPLDTAHSLRFVLVDGRGHIRGLFDKTDEDIDRLSAALRHLANPK